MPKADTQNKSPRKKGRWVRRLLILAVLGVVLLVAAVLALPPIASSLVPAEIEAAVNPTIEGSIEVDSVKLSLFGSQEIGEVRVLDPQGKLLGTMQATIQASGLSVVLGNFDLGKIIVTGNLDVTRDANGKIDLAEAFAPTKPAASATAPSTPTNGAPKPAPKLPKSLAAHLIFDKINLTYTDAALSDATGGQIRTLAIPDFGGSIRVLGDSWGGGVLGTMMSGAGPSSLVEDGLLSLTFGGKKLRSNDGTLTLDALEGELDFTITTRDISGDIHLLVQDGVLTLDESSDITPDQLARHQHYGDGTSDTEEISTSISIDLQPWAGRLVAVQDALANTPGLTIDQFPKAALVIDSLHVELPKGGAPLDLRRIAAEVSLIIEPISGSADPAALGMTSNNNGQRQPFSTERTSISLTLDDQHAAFLTAKGSAKVGAESAGTLDAQFTFGDLFDEQGRFTMPGTIVGEASLNQVATAILDPFVAAILQRDGVPLVRLTEDLGPTLDLSLNAQSVASQNNETNTINLTGKLTSEMVRGSLNIFLAGSQISSSMGDSPTKDANPAAVLTFREPAALLRRIIPEVRVSHADPIRISVSQFRTNLDALSATTPDLRSTQAIVTLDAGTIAGSVTDSTGATKAFGAGPFTGTLITTGLGKGRVTLSLDGSGAYDGRSAGTLKVNGLVTDLLDNAGALRTDGVPQIDLTAVIENASSALLAAFVPLEKLGLDPARDLGPTINASLTASNPSADELHADLRVTSDHLEIVGPLSITAQRITAREPITFTQTSPTALLSALTRLDPPLTTVLDRPALIRGTIESFTLPLGEGLTPQPQLATAKASFLLQNMQSSGIILTRITGTADLSPANGVNLTGQLVAARSGKGFGGSLEAHATRVFDDAGALLAPIDMQPTATLELHDAPPALARLLPRPPPNTDPSAPPPLDLAAMFADFTGGLFSLDVRFDAKSKNQTISAKLDSPRTTLDARASLNNQTLSTEALTLNTQITAPALGRLLRAAGMTPDQLPSLSEPAALTMRVEPFTLPLTDSFAPDAAKATDTLRLSGTLAASVNALSPASGNSGPIRLSDSTFSLQSPLAVLLGSTRGVAAVAAAGKIASPNDGSGSFTLNANPTLESGALAGPFAINATLADVPVAFIDALAGQPGLVLGAVGPTLSLDLAANVDTSAASPVESISLGVRSQRVNTTKPLKIVASGTTLRLAAPAELRLVVDPVWANEYLLGANKKASDGTDTPPPLFTLSAPTNATLTLNQLVLPSKMAGVNGAPGGPLKLGVFLIDAVLDLPQTSIVVGESNAPVTITGGTLKLKPTTIAGATLDYDLVVRQWTASGRQSLAEQPSHVWGTLYGLASASGQVQPETLNATGAFDLPNVPSALVDAFARTDLPSKVLGETVSIEGWYRHISSIAGAFHFEATSPNAVAAADGSFNNGIMLINKPADGSPVATISRITPELTNDLAKALPLLQSFEKTAQDEPARLILDTNIAVPIDGNMNNLTGYFNMDMGTGRFVVQNQFLGMLKIPGLNEEGRVGRRLETLHVVMDRGVIAYHPYPVPLGEFELISVGIVNLSDRPWDNKDADLKAGPGGNVDILTYIPAGALAQEAIGPLGVPFGLGPDVFIPFRTRGPLDSTKTNIDLDHLAREALSPENLIKGAGDLLGEPGEILKGIGDLFGGGG